MSDNSEYFKKRIFSFELECSIDGANRVIEILQKSLINYTCKNLKFQIEKELSENAKAYINRELNK